MYGVLQILVSASIRRRLAAAAALGLLAACGQKGPLVLPVGEAATGRASLPQTLMPAPSTAVVPAQAASSPPTGTAAPVRNP
jgi:predicted small lipoprotein YifL